MSEYSLAIFKMCVRWTASQREDEKKADLKGNERKENSDTKRIFMLASFESEKNESFHTVSTMSMFIEEML